MSDVGGPTILVNRHLSHLYLCMVVEKVVPQEPIQGLVEDGAARTLALDAGAQLSKAQDEFTD